MRIATPATGMGLGRASVHPGARGFHHRSPFFDFTRHKVTKLCARHVWKFSTAIGPTGFDLAQKLRSISPQIGIVFLTTYQDPRFAAISGAHAPKGSRYLVKSEVSGVVFDFSFSATMNSFQVSMCLGSQVLATLSSEGVETIDIFHEQQTDGIQIIFKIDGSLAQARLTLWPDVTLHWWILCNRGESNRLQMQHQGC